MNTLTLRPQEDKMFRWHYLLFIPVAFLTWFIIRFATIDNSLSVVDLYEFPALPELSNADGLENSNFAFSVDGKVIQSSEHEAQPIASTAKMILGLAVMRAKPFNPGETGEILTLDEADYDRYAWYYNHGGSVTPVRSGEEISQYDALASVFLASSNNMADSLAIWAFGSHEAYKEYATDMLREFKLENTVIGDDASGFSDTTRSTSSDLAIIGHKVLNDPVLAEIVATKSYEAPVAGLIHNTNKLIGVNNIIGVKTGYIGDASGYCLVSGYKEGDHIITVSLLDAPTREASFDDSLAIISNLQESAKNLRLASEGQTVGYLESWWAGRVPIRTSSDFSELAFAEAEKTHELNFDEGKLKISINDNNYEIEVAADEFKKEPSFIEKIMRVFGWEKEKAEIDADKVDRIEESAPAGESTQTEEPDPAPTETQETEKFTNATSSNCTIGFGRLMLINPNFTVENSFIATRGGELVSLSSRYGIVEGVAGNGDNLLDAEAAVHINDMVNAYKAAYPGHTLETRSCFRAYGTKCGRLCAATGASDHHTGLTCDLIDPVYGTSLDTDTYDQHIDWQWLRANSYKYGFIDRFPEAWAGGPMSAPLNVDENGSTGLFETWHYRYVGINAATEIATGKYNNGQYDSLEHYLKATGKIADLKNGRCYNN